MAFRWVVDARGVDRRVYNLRARWRSVRMQREFPEPLFKAICRTAAGGGADTDSYPLEVASRRGAAVSLPGIAIALLTLALIGYVLLLGLEIAGIGMVKASDAMLPLIISFLILMLVLDQKSNALRNRVPLPGPPRMPWVDDGQMAAAIVVNGRCPSCAYPVDPARREADGAVVCAECGGAWMVVRRGGELRLGR